MAKGKCESGNANYAKCTGWKGIIFAIWGSLVYTESTSKKDIDIESEGQAAQRASLLDSDTICNQVGG